MTDEPRVAVFRPDDDRLTTAVERLEALGAQPVADPMLAVESADRAPAGDDWVVFTSKTGIELADEAGWRPDGSRLAAIGASTAEAAREAGWTVDVVPDDYSSAGLVAALTQRLEPDARVELARSDHGSAVLPDGLREAGLDVRETTLYRLVRPPESGVSAELAARGDLDGAAFTSSLTVEHFLAAAEQRASREAVIAGVADATVGAIGAPTADTAREHGIDVDAVPDEADFDRLAERILSRIRE